MFLNKLMMMMMMILQSYTNYSRCLLLSQSLTDTVIGLIIAEFVVGISTLSVAVLVLWIYKYFRFWRPTSLFLVVGRYRNHLPTPYSNSPGCRGRKTQICRRYFIMSACNSDISIPQFCRYFRLSMVDAMAWEHFRRSHCSRKPQV